MAYGDVKEHFSKGELNDLWNFIEFVGEIFPSKRDNIEKLKNSFIRYALVKPWPLGNDEEPEFFEIKLWAREYADFNYYIGLGVGLKAGAEIADEGKASFDLESAILSARIEFPAFFYVLIEDSLRHLLHLEAKVVLRFPIEAANDGAANGTSFANGISTRS